MDGGGHHRLVRGHRARRSAAGRRQGRQPGRADARRHRGAAGLRGAHGGLRALHAGARERRRRCAPRVEALRAGRSRRRSRACSRRAARARARRADLPAERLRRAAAGARRRCRGDAGDAPWRCAPRPPPRMPATPASPGLQDTYLWVSDAERMLDRVRDCWASLYSVESISYRRDRGIAEAARWPWRWWCSRWSTRAPRA